MLQIGTRVVAVRNFGPVKEGQPGIVTGTAEERWLWRTKLIYLCTFADNVRIAARPKEVEDFDHGYSLADLEAPNFLSVQAAHAREQLKARRDQAATPPQRSQG
jgi:hypothetical protein